MIAPQIRGIKTNIPFLENVMRHPDFLSGEATTFFIEQHQRELFNFERHGSLRSSKLLTYLAGEAAGRSQAGGGAKG